MTVKELMEEVEAQLRAIDDRLRRLESRDTDQAIEIAKMQTKVTIYKIFGCSTAGLLLGVLGYFATILIK